MEVNSKILNSQEDLLKLVLVSNLRIIRKLDRLLTTLSQNGTDYQRQFLVDNLSECIGDLSHLETQLLQREKEEL